MFLTRPLCFFSQESEGVAKALVARRHFFSAKAWADLSPRPDQRLLDQLAGSAAADRPSRIQANIPSLQKHKPFQAKRKHTLS